jgi:hypothetical protein
MELTNNEVERGLRRPSVPVRQFVLLGLPALFVAFDVFGWLQRVARDREKLSVTPAGVKKANDFAWPHPGKEIAVSDERGKPRADLRSSATVGHRSPRVCQEAPRRVPRARTRELRGPVAEVR